MPVSFFELSVPTSTKLQLKPMTLGHNKSLRLTGPALRRAIRDAVGKHLDLGVHELFIFGSEVLGTGTE